MIALCLTQLLLLTNIFLSVCWIGNILLILGKRLTFFSKTLDGGALVKSSAFFALLIDSGFDGLDGGCMVVGTIISAKSLDIVLVLMPIDFLEIYF